MEAIDSGEDYHEVVQERREKIKDAVEEGGAAEEIL